MNGFETLCDQTAVQTTDDSSNKKKNRSQSDGTMPSIFEHRLILIS